MFKKLNAFKLLIGTFAVALALVVTSSASAFTLADFGSTTLKVGSTGQAVMNVQTVVGATADGKFGPNTKAKVMAWQSNHSLTADGVVGPMTKAAMAANDGTSMTYPAGCTSATGFSSTTGQPCSSTSTVPGCAAGAMYSSTTGQLCSGGTTTVNSGTNGYLADLAADSTNRVSTVYESEQDKVVAGFRATARLADQKVDRVRVTFVNSNTSSSANLGKYISGASLWMGSTKLATMSVAQADRGTSDDIYTFNFSGLSATVPMNQVGRFYVSVNANGSLDTNDTTSANWTVSFVAAGVSATSPDGTYDTYPSTAITQTGLLFGKFASSGVKSEVSLSSANPASAVIPVSATATTNGIEVLKFKVKATNSNLTLRKIPVQVVLTSGTPADDVTNVINTVKLMQGSNTVDTLSGTQGYEATSGSLSTTTTACTDSSSPSDDVCAFFFSNLSSPYNTVSSGSEVEYTVVVDLKSQANYAAGTTLTFSLVNADVLSSTAFSVQDMNGDQLPNSPSNRVGSGVGQIMTLQVNGVNVIQSAATISTITDQAGIVTGVTYNIPLTVTSFGQTLYIGQAADLAAAASGATTSAKAFSFALQDATAPANDVTSAPTGVSVSSTLASSDAQIETNGFRLDSGSAKHFTLQVILSCSASSCSSATTANYRVHVGTVRSATDGALTSPSNQTLLPVQSYQTGYQKIK